MMNGSPLSPVDVLGALTSVPARFDPSAVLEQVRGVAASGSKAALIAAAVSQAGSPSDETVALAAFGPLIASSALRETEKADMLDGLAVLMREVVAVAGASEPRRRILVIGVGELLRFAANGGAGSELTEALKVALTAAARRGSVATTH